MTGIASGCHVKAQDVGRGTKDADVAADPGIPLRHDLPLRADRALPRLRNLQRHATHGGLQVVATATSKFDELLIQGERSEPLVSVEMSVVSHLTPPWWLGLEG